MIKTMVDAFQNETDPSSDRVPLPEVDTESETDPEVQLLTTSMSQSFRGFPGFKRVHSPEPVPFTQLDLDHPADTWLFRRDDSHRPR